VGREEELAEVRRLLGSPPPGIATPKSALPKQKVRLLTFTGAGGCGKTRLAIEAARSLAQMGSFKNGEWWVDLTALSDPSLVPNMVASALGLPESPGTPIEKTLGNFLRSKELLLVLDNTEHLIAACASLARALLNECPGLVILATSREPLGIPGEVLWRVPSLATPEPGTEGYLSTADLLEYSAIGLFTDRAQAVSPGWSLSGSATEVVSICSRLGGIPLAIELAAARVRMMDVEQINARLQDAFSLLTGGSRTALPRHQTLRSCIDWSYNLLSEPEKILLQRLSAFSGGWTLESAEAVTAERDKGEGIKDKINHPPESAGSIYKADSSSDLVYPLSFILYTSQVLDVLGQLVDKSLVIVTQTKAKSVRYRMLETIRQYARERLLAVGGEPLVRVRHLDYFLELALRAEPNLRARDQAAWMDRLDEELDNIRSALEWSLATRIEDGLQLAAALLWFWHIRGHGIEGIDWLNKLMETEARERVSQPPETDRLLARANALNAAGVLLAMPNTRGQSTPLLKESLEIFRGLGQAGCRGVAIALLYLTWGAEMQPNSPAMIEESLALFREMGDKFYLAECLMSIGDALRIRGHIVEAIQIQEENLALRKEIGDQDGIGIAYYILGILAQNQGDYSRARDMFDKSLACYRAVNNTHLIIDVIQRQAFLFWIQGDDDQAIRICEEALAMSQELKARQLIERAYCILGMVAWSSGDYDLAKRHCEEALAVGQEIGNCDIIIAAHHHLGKVALSQGDYALARTHIIKVFSMFQNFSDLESDNDFLVFTADLATARNQWERAAKLLGAADHICPWAINVIPPVERIERTNSLSAVRAGLGEEAFTKAWAEGHAMTVEQAMAYASALAQEEN
jgi:non-specific serine/threonine protein kinase